jgi:hypothetical protein
MTHVLMCKLFKMMTHVLMCKLFSESQVLMCKLFSDDTGADMQAV